MKRLVALVIVGLLLFSCKKECPYDGSEVFVQAYNDFEEISSDTVIIEKGEIVFDPEQFDEGVYYIMSIAELVPSALAEGFPFYLNEKKRGSIKVTDKDIILGGNPENAAYQKLRSQLGKLDAEEDFAKQLVLWDKYFEEYLSHPLGEEVFINDFDAYQAFMFDPEQVEHILTYADESFYSRPAVMELKTWMGTTGATR